MADYFFNDQSSVGSWFQILLQMGKRRKVNEKDALTFMNNGS